MGLMKRVLLHHMAAGTTPPSNIRFKRSAFGMEDPEPTKKPRKKKKQKDDNESTIELPVLSPGESRPSILKEALQNAERTLGRKIKPEELCTLVSPTKKK